MEEKLESCEIIKKQCMYCSFWDEKDACRYARNGDSSPVENCEIIEENFIPIKEAENFKVYLASGWFTREQSHTMSKLNQFLRICGFDVHAPYYDGVVLDKTNDDDDLRIKAFERNLYEIEQCNVLVAVIDNFEPGTIFEMGEFFGFLRGIWLAGLSAEGRQGMIAYSDVAGRSLNVMLQQASWGFANGTLQLYRQLNNFVKGKPANNFVSFNKGDVF